MTRAHRTGLLRAVSLAIAALAATTALAQDPAPTPTPTPEPTPAAAHEPKIQVGGWVDVYYGYNFNGTDPLLRTYDVQNNAFSLSAAELNFTKTPTAQSRVGFRTDLWFGKAADLTALFEPQKEGSISSLTEGKEVYKNIQQAYVSVLAGGVQIDAGKFVTPIGAEVIESQDDWNYSRSTLFGYAIPFYHTGVRATVSAGPKLAIAGYLVNGWNSGIDVDGDKTFALGVTFKPTASFTWIGNYMVGKEAEGLDTRHLFDTTLTLAATSKLSFMGNLDYGKEGDVEWWGVAAYAKLQATPAWAVVARYEYLDDTKGGFMTFGTKAQTLTVTSDSTIAGALKLRLEYRTDFADEDIFETDDGAFKGSQTTLMVGVVYSFGAGLF
jgi:hypothetical protein